MYSLWKIVYDGEKDCFTLRGRQTNDEVHWDVRPRLFRGCKRVLEAGWRWTDRFVLSTQKTCRKMLPGFFDQGRPPEGALKKSDSPVLTGMAGQLRGMEPVDDSLMDVGWNIQPVGWTATWIKFIPFGNSDQWLHLGGEWNSERKSGFAFREPGRWVIVKLKPGKKAPLDWNLVIISVDKGETVQEVTDHVKHRWCTD